MMSAQASMATPERKSEATEDHLRPTWSMAGMERRSAGSSRPAEMVKVT